MGEDLYQILGIDRGADDKEIKKKYRRLARELHPDRNEGNKQTEERFKKVSAAYAVLGDKEKRKLYDSYGIDGLRDGFDPQKWGRYSAQGSGPQGRVDGPFVGQGFDFGGFSGFGALEDIFESLFEQAGSRVRTRGNQSRGQRRSGTRGADIKSVIEVELLDVVLGRELEIAVPLESGFKRLKVKIPKGLDHGQTIRLKGQGVTGQGLGAEVGDLLLEIQLKPHREFERQGLDLTRRETITVGQAYHGATISVSTPWGEVKLKVPPSTQGGAKLRLKGKGVQRAGKKGDLIVELQIRIPSSKDRKTTEIVDNLERRY